MQSLRSQFLPQSTHVCGVYTREPPPSLTTRISDLTLLCQSGFLPFEFSQDFRMRIIDPHPISERPKRHLLILTVSGKSSASIGTNLVDNNGSELTEAHPRTGSLVSNSAGSARGRTFGPMTWRDWACVGHFIVSAEQHSI